MVTTQRTGQEDVTNGGPLAVPRDDYDDDLWSEILPSLWMGGTAFSDEVGRVREIPMITPHHFHTVITLYADAQPVDHYVKEIRLGFFDHDHVDVDLGDLAHAVHVGHSDWVRGRRVLIRCQAGWNRSGLVTALIMMRDGHDVDTAIQLIRSQRSRFALGNTAFEKWLRKDAKRFLNTIPPISSQGITGR
jgi:protein-tyrosine phosphatase